jgi:hypothetical protein
MARQGPRLWRRPESGRRDLNARPPEPHCTNAVGIFHKDFGYSKGLVHLGRIDSDIEAVRVRGALKVTLERIEK